MTVCKPCKNSFVWALLSPPASRALAKKEVSVSFPMRLESPKTCWIVPMSVPVAFAHIAAIFVRLSASSWLTPKEVCCKAVSKKLYVDKPVSFARAVAFSRKSSVYWWSPLALYLLLNALRDAKLFSYAVASALSASSSPASSLRIPPVPVANAPTPAIIAPGITPIPLAATIPPALIKVPPKFIATLPIWSFAFAPAPK